MIYGVNLITFSNHIGEDPRALPSDLLFQCIFFLGVEERGRKGDYLRLFGKEPLLCRSGQTDSGVSEYSSLARPRVRSVSIY